MREYNHEGAKPAKDAIGLPKSDGYSDNTSGARFGRPQTEQKMAEKFGKSGRVSRRP